MDQVILLGFALPLIAFTWQWAVKPAFLAAAEDRLDELVGRVQLLKAGRPGDDVAALDRLADYIGAQSLCLDRATFARLRAFDKLAGNKPGIVVAINDEVKRRTCVSSDTLAATMTSIREECANVVVDWVIKRNLFLFLALTFIFPFGMAYLTLRTSLVDVLQLFKKNAYGRIFYLVSRRIYFAPIISLEEEVAFSSLCERQAVLRGCT